jgi:type VI secretion system secreted protein VgrG
MDRTRFPDERRFFVDEEGRRLFPFLGDAFEVLGPSTMAYNCIAHSLGKINEWVNPRTGPAGDTLVPMEQLYRDHGFERTVLPDCSLAAGATKIAVYASTDAHDTIQEVTHAAIQEDDGTWTSKIGGGPLIRHAMPEALQGPAYGKVVAVFVRPR